MNACSPRRNLAGRRDVINESNQLIKEAASAASALKGNPEATETPNQEYPEKQS
jgi:hypothetical protein